MKRHLVLALVPLVAAVGVASAGETALPMKAKAAAPAASVSAPAMALPDGRALLRAFAAASGGAEALTGIENAIVHSTYSIPAQSMEGTITIAFAKPDKIRSVGEMSGIGTIEQGFDGTTGWESNPMSGARLLSPLELKQLQNSESNVFNLAALETLYEKAETLGRASFGGADTWEVRLVADGRESTAYFDPTSRLMIGMKTTVASQLGEIPAVITLEDYKSFGKLMLPSKSTQSLLGGMIEARSTIDAVEFNVSADKLPSFAPPAEILALKGEAAGE